jgi:hypothetical protein
MSARLSNGRVNVDEVYGIIKNRMEVFSKFEKEITGFLNREKKC